jgi:ADP-heptose:LPS heptosyltransferase
LKVLIIRLSSIGDIILTSPAVRYAKQNLGAEVHYLTKKAYAELLINNPNIDKLFLYEGNLNQNILELKAENYDYIFDLHNNLRSWIIKLRLKVNSRSLSKNNFQKWLMVKFKRKTAIQHIIHRYIYTISNQQISEFDDKMDFYYKPDPNLRENKNLPDTYYCISLGAKHYTKRIPIELITDILSGINEKVVLIGGKDMLAEGTAIAGKFTNKVLNLCGMLSIWQSAQIIEYSVLVLTSDTGMMHLAAALNKETHVIWGNTVPEFGMFAYYGKNISKTYNYEVKLTCRPCSRIGFDKCPENHFNCMLMQDQNHIISGIKASFKELNRVL